MRGDRPRGGTVYGPSGRFTPHARGSTSAAAAAVRSGSVYPACAGIDPPKVSRISARKGLPRMRGDRPVAFDIRILSDWFTPHARGSTLVEGLEGLMKEVYPACAGIDLGSPTTSYFSSRLPRMRGDRPHMHSLSLKTARFTPHARGSTFVVVYDVVEVPVYPACAGIDPIVRIKKGGSSGLPRMRGDRPMIRRIRDSPYRFTPHARGST